MGQVGGKRQQRGRLDQLGGVPPGAEDLARYHFDYLQTLSLRELKRLISGLVLDVDPDTFQNADEALLFLEANSLH